MTDPAETWEQLQLRLKWPEQRSYELIRPVVVFADSAAERAAATGEPIRTIYRSPQLAFWDRQDPLWRNAYRVPLYPVRKRRPQLPVQTQLTFPLDECA